MSFMTERKARLIETQSSNSQSPGSVSQDAYLMRKNYDIEILSLYLPA